MTFEWDENKNKKNIQKHGISFAHATLIFTDENLITDYDYTHSVTEDRYIAIGRVDEILFVVYTERPPESDNIRIISARTATKQEEEIYYGNSTLY